MWRAYEPRDPRFWKYLYNTLYLMLGIPVSIAGSLAFALLLNNSFGLARSRRIAGTALCLMCGLVTVAVVWAAGSTSTEGTQLFRDLAALGGVLWLLAALGIAFDVVAFRTILYLPTFTSGVALMLLWKSLFNPKSGMINALLAQAANTAIAAANGVIAAWNGLLCHAGGTWHPIAALGATDMPLWLGSTAWARPALITMGVWTVIGGTNMLLYLAGLSNVPGELLDAAKVDGAGPWQRFRHIIWPQLAPTTFFISIMSIIGGLQGGFEQARVMTEGGPDGSTTTLNYYIYNVFYQDLELGYGATIAWVLFALIFAATAVNWKYGKNIEVGS
jgi:multiple sugar transport system permease protein